MQLRRRRFGKKDANFRHTLRNASILRPEARGTAHARPRLCFRFVMEAGAGFAISVDESAVPAYVLPDPLRFEDGSPVTDASGWRRRRREILSLFESHVYGRLPRPAGAPRVEEIGAEGPAAGLPARRLQRRVRLPQDRDGRGLDLLLFLLEGAPTPGRAAPFRPGRWASPWRWMPSAGFPRWTRGASRSSATRASARPRSGPAPSTSASPW